MLDGLPLRLVDTAWYSGNLDIVEQAGIERSKQALAQADLVLLMLGRQSTTGWIFVGAATHRVHRSCGQFARPSVFGVAL